MHLLYLLVRSTSVVLGVNRHHTVLEIVKRNTGGNINTTVESNSTHAKHPPILRLLAITMTKTKPTIALLTKS
jgi:hypothetical protein